jgi:hypothetical protein
MPALKFKPGFWDKVSWGRGDSPRRALCAMCHGALPEVPLTLWREADHASISLCDRCIKEWIVGK